MRKTSVFLISLLLTLIILPFFNLNVNSQVNYKIYSFADVNQDADPYTLQYTGFCLQRQWYFQGTYGSSTYLVIGIRKNDGSLTVLQFKQVGNAWLNEANYTFSNTKSFLFNRHNSTHISLVYTTSSAVYCVLINPITKTVSSKSTSTTTNSAALWTTLNGYPYIALGYYQSWGLYRVNPDGSINVIYTPGTDSWDQYYSIIYYDTTLQWLYVINSNAHSGIKHQVAVKNSTATTCGSAIPGVMFDKLSNGRWWKGTFYTQTSGFSSSYIWAKNWFFGNSKLSTESITYNNIQCFVTSASWHQWGFDLIETHRDKVGLDASAVNFAGAYPLTSYGSYEIWAFYWYYAPSNSLSYTIFNCSSGSPIQDVPLQVDTSYHYPFFITPWGRFEINEGTSAMTLYIGNPPSSVPTITPSSTSSSTTIPTFTATGGITDLPTGVQFSVNTIIPLFICLVPALIMGATFGVFGAVVGALIGVGVGVSTGFIPFFILVLCIIGVAGLLVYGRREGGGGG